MNITNQELIHQQNIEIEQLKKELNINKADFREVNTVIIPKVSARIYKLEDDNRQLKKENEWLLDKTVQGLIGENIRAEQREIVISKMQQALKEKIK